MALGVLTPSARAACADPKTRLALPHVCGGPLKEQLGARYLCAFTPYRSSPACNLRGLGAAAVAPAPAPVLGPEMCANPLPPGRYAIKIFDNPKGAPHAFEYWADQEHVTIVSKAEIPPPSGMAPGLAVIFTVSSPVLFNYTIFGCPNVVDSKLSISQLSPAEADTSLWSSIFGGSSGGSGVPLWVYLGLGTVALVAIAPTLFNVSKIVEMHEEKKT